MAKYSRTTNATGFQIVWKDIRTGEPSVNHLGGFPMSTDDADRFRQLLEEERSEIATHDFVYSVDRHDT